MSSYTRSGGASMWANAMTVYLVDNRRVCLERLDSERFVDLIGEVHKAAFDDQFPLSDRSNILGGIAVHQVHVGELSWSDRPQLSIEAEEPRTPHGRHAEDGRRWNARLHPRLELAMQHHPGDIVRAGDELNAVLVQHPQHVF